MQEIRKEWELDRLFSLENRENPTEKAKLLEGAGLDEKLLLMNGLEQGLTERVKTCLLEKAYMNGIYEELARIKKEAAGVRAFDEILESCICGKKERDAILKERPGAAFREEWEIRQRVTSESWESGRKGNFWRDRQKPRFSSWKRLGRR